MEYKQEKVKKIRRDIIEAAKRLLNKPEYKEILPPISAIEAESGWTSVTIRAYFGGPGPLWLHVLGGHSWAELLKEINSKRGTTND